MTDPQSLRQDQFLDVIGRAEAERRFHAALKPRPLGSEQVALDDALNRVVAEDVRSAVDVPSFDRSNFDGFAVQAADTYGAVETAPRRLRLLGTSLPAGKPPTTAVVAGGTVPIATGGMLPRGADAVVMIEHTDVVADQLIVRHAVTPGAGVTFAGTDVAVGESVVRAGTALSSRETGVLAAIGADPVIVYRRPRVAILSTGDELLEPGAAIQPAKVYDSNSRILADAVREHGGLPHRLGIVPDDRTRLRDQLHAAVQDFDLVLLSGGTSKGAGDICYRVVSEFNDPGIVAHGVALKPGKPVCLAVTQGKAVVVLPGFPTSAIFTFHEFVVPVLRQLAGWGPHRKPQAIADLALKLNSEIGRTEYVLVGLVAKPKASETAADAVETWSQPGTSHASEGDSLAAYPLGKGSGSVTTFSHADGFVTVDQHKEIVEAGTRVNVTLLGATLEVADLIVIGSHCIGVEYLLGRMQRAGWRTKYLAVGSVAGLAAAERGECDIAGIHLLDPVSGQYNVPFATHAVQVVNGYRRRQGVVFRGDDERLRGADARAVVARAVDSPACLMINRNQGSGTRILIDALLAGQRPPGYAVQARTHSAVVAAVGQGRADWGVAIEYIARHAGLGFLPLADEEFDFAIPETHLHRPAVAAWLALLKDPAIRRDLAGLGLQL